LQTLEKDFKEILQKNSEQEQYTQKLEGKIVWLQQENEKAQNEIQDAIEQNDGLKNKLAEAEYTISVESSEAWKKSQVSFIVFAINLLFCIFYLD
jgi:hypothetical protein